MTLYYRVELTVDELSKFHRFENYDYASKAAFIALMTEQMACLCEGEGEDQVIDNVGDCEMDVSECTLSDLVYSYPETFENVDDVEALTSDEIVALLHEHDFYYVQYVEHPESEATYMFVKV